MSLLEVTPAQLRSKAAELLQMNEHFRSSIEELKAEEQALGSMWEGEAKAAFHSAFSNDCAQFEQFAAAIAGFSSVLTNIANNYEEADRRSGYIARIVGPGIGTGSSGGGYSGGTSGAQSSNTSGGGGNGYSGGGGGGGWGDSNAGSSGGGHSSGGGRTESSGSGSGGGFSSGNGSSSGGSGGGGGRTGPTNNGSVADAIREGAFVNFEGFRKINNTNISILYAAPEIKPSAGISAQIITGATNIQMLYGAPGISGSPSGTGAGLDFGGKVASAVNTTVVYAAPSAIPSGAGSGLDISSKVESAVNTALVYAAPSVLKDIDLSEIIKKIK